jgi:hypothetical protein
MAATGFAWADRRFPLRPLAQIDFDGEFLSLARLLLTCF